MIPASPVLIIKAIGSYWFSYYTSQLFFFITLCIQNKTGSRKVPKIHLSSDALLFLKRQVVNKIMFTFPHFVEIFVECAGLCDLGQFKHYAISEMKTVIGLILNLIHDDICFWNIPKQSQKSKLILVLQLDVMQEILAQSRFLFLFIYTKWINNKDCFPKNCL